MKNNMINTTVQSYASVVSSPETRPVHVQSTASNTADQPQANSLLKSIKQKDSARKQYEAPVEQDRVKANITNHDNQNKTYEQYEYRGQHHYTMLVL